jgi:hypothetical protein
MAISMLVLALAGCDQPVTAPGRPRPVAVVPEAAPPSAASEESRLREVLRRLVAYSRTPEGRAALRPQQETTEAKLAAALASAPGSAERESVDQLMTRLRALNATPTPATVHRPD